MYQSSFSARAVAVRFALLFVATLIAVGYAFWSFNTYRAAGCAKKGDLAAIKRSAELRPLNASYHAQLGHLALVSGDLDTARTGLQQATTLNSHDSGYWLALAEAAEVSGDENVRKQAIERAVAVDPTTPAVLWEAANFHLAAGDTDGALPLFRSLLSYDDHSDNAVAAVLAGSGLPAKTVLEAVLPKRMQAHVAYLQRLLLRKRMNDADLSWTHLVQLHQPIPPEGVAPYYNALVSAKQTSALREAWVATIASNPGMSEPEPGELVTNGGFEDRLVTAGLDWTFDDASGNGYAIDTTEFRSGLRSLRADFNNEKDAGNRFRQIVPVQPGQAYELSIAAKSEDVLSASGPRILVTDAYSGEQLGTTDELLGSTSWRKLQIRFTTPPETALVRIALARTSPSLRIRGRIWIDDVSLRRESREN